MGAEVDRPAGSPSRELAYPQVQQAEALAPQRAMQQRKQVPVPALARRLRRSALTAALRRRAELQPIDRLRDFGREHVLPWMRLIPARRSESRKWGGYDPETWKLGIDPPSYIANNYRTKKEVLEGQRIWNTDFKFSQVSDMVARRLRKNGAVALPPRVRVGGLATGATATDAMTAIAISQRMHVEIEKVVMYEPVDKNRAYGKEQWQQSIARARAIRKALLEGDNDTYQRLLGEQARNDRFLLYANIFGIDLTDADKAGLDGGPLDIDWEELDVFSPPPDLFEALDIATDFYGSCSLTDSPARFAATLITKMRMLKPGGLLIGVNEATTGAWKGYGASLPGANVPPHVMREILGILDPNVELDSIELDTDTTDDHVPATIIMSVLQKSADFEARLHDIRQKLVNLLSLPDSMALEGMEPPSAAPDERAVLANNTIVPVGAIQVSDDAAPLLLTLMRDKYGNRQVFAFEGFPRYLTRGEGLPLTTLESSVMHAEAAPDASGWISVVDHRGAVTLHNIFDGDEIAIGGELGSAGDRQLGPWSPVGSQFVVTAAAVEETTGRQTTEVYVVDVSDPEHPRRLVHEDGEDWTQTTDHGDGTVIPHPHGTQRTGSLLWSGNDTLLAIRRRTGASDEIWRINPNTGERQCLVGPDTGNERYLWNPHPRDHEREPGYEPLDQRGPISFDNLFMPADARGHIGLTAGFGGQRHQYMATFEPPGNGSTAAGRLWLTGSMRLVNYFRPGGGVTLVVPYNGGPTLYARKKSIHFHAPFAGPQNSSNARGSNDLTRLGHVVMAGKTAVFPALSPIDGPALCRIDTTALNTVEDARSISRAYQRMHAEQAPGEETLVDLYAVRRTVEWQDFSSDMTTGHLVVPHGYRSRMLDEAPLPVLVWVTDVHARTDESSHPTYPGWMKTLVTRFGIAVLVHQPRVGSAAEQATDSPQRRRDIVASLHREIELLRQPRTDQFDARDMLDGTRIMLAGDSTVADLLAAHPDDAAAAAIFADDPAPVLAAEADADNGYDGPLFIAGSASQIEALAPAAARWRERGRKIVTVAANDERSGRFKAAKNEAALRLLLTEFFRDAAPPRPEGAPNAKASVALSHPLSKPRAPTEWTRYSPRGDWAHTSRGSTKALAGRPTARLVAQGAVASVRPNVDTTGSIWEVEVQTRGHAHDQRLAAPSLLTAQLDAPNRRVTVLGIKNPPELGHAGLWAELLYEALCQFEDVETIAFAPVAELPIYQEDELPRVSYFIDVLGQAFMMRGEAPGRLWHRTEATKGDPRLTVVMSRKVRKGDSE